jgi:hypothetical protein
VPVGKGVIGKAEILVALEGISPERVTETIPAARQAGHNFRWTFRDFEPGAGGAPESVELTWRVVKDDAGE